MQLNPIFDAATKALPPVWVDTVNSIKVDLSMIREKDAELARLHQARLKVVFDDNQTKQLDLDIQLYSQTVSKVVFSFET